MIGGTMKPMQLPLYMVQEQFSTPIIALQKLIKLYYG